MRFSRTIILSGVVCVIGCASYSPPKKSFLNVMFDGLIDGLFDSAADEVMGVDDDYAFTPDSEDEAQILQRKGIDPQSERYEKLKAERQAKEMLDEKMK
jgi:hypothetical protein